MKLTFNRGCVQPTIGLKWIQKFEGAYGFIDQMGKTGLSHMRSNFLTALR